MWIWIHLFQFLLAMVHDHLNSNDLFWRLLERGNLQYFLESLTHLLEGILLCLDEATRGRALARCSKLTSYNEYMSCLGLFLEAIFITVSKLSSPSSLFFLSEAFVKIQVFRCLSGRDMILIKWVSVLCSCNSILLSNCTLNIRCRTLIKKAQHIQHTTMRFMTQFNFVAFFCKMLIPVCLPLCRIYLLGWNRSISTKILLHCILDHWMCEWAGVSDSLLFSQYANAIWPIFWHGTDPWIVIGPRREHGLYPACFAKSKRFRGIIRRYSNKMASVLSDHVIVACKSTTPRCILQLFSLRAALLIFSFRKTISLLFYGSVLNFWKRNTSCKRGLSWS